jgi:hypothetical protein
MVVVSVACASSTATPSASGEDGSAAPTTPPSAGATSTPTSAPTRTPTPVASATPEATPDGGPPIGALTPGGYRAHFDPAFTFTLGSGWERNLPDERLSDAYLQLLYAAGNGGELLFIEVSALGVEGSLERFDQFRFTEVEPAAPATIGGVSGLAIVGGRPPALTVVRGIPSGSDYVLAANDRIRATAIVVDGVTVTFIVEATSDDYDAFRPIADEVLQSVAFPIGG